MKKLLTLISSIFFTSQGLFANAPKVQAPSVDIKAPMENAVVLKPKQKKSMILDSNTKIQGDFFYVVMTGLKDEPRIWFNAQEYPVFEITDTQEWNSIMGKRENRLYRALIPVENMTKPGKYSILARTEAWENRQDVIIEDNKKPISKITLSPGKSSIYASQKELDIVGSSLRTKTDEKLWQGKFSYPCKAPKSSPFGVKRSYNGAPASGYHKGLDFAADKGAPVYAPADANVVAVGKESEGFNVHGNTVILDHGHGVTSIYMHLSKTDVRKAQDVKAGEKIGEVGHTGISTGPHLHWGVYLSGTSVDPELFVNQDVI